MNSRQITFSQFTLYLRALGEDHKRELKERAIAARVAGATAEGWDEFMVALDSVAERESKAELIDRACAKKPPEANDEDIEWQTLN
ncbi:MAG TPA: hypothetical protein VII85_00310 [Candidatus Krumholzibacteriaceae bacterium]